MAVDAVDGSGVSVSTFRFARSISSARPARPQDRASSSLMLRGALAAARARDDERVALAGRSCGGR